MVGQDLGRSYIKGVTNTGLPSISGWRARDKQKFVSPVHRGSRNLHDKPLLEGVGMIWGVARENGWCRLEVMQLKWRDGARRSPVNQSSKAPTWTETGRVSNCCPAGSAGGQVGFVLRSVVSTVTAKGSAIGCRPKVCSWIGWPSSGAAPWGQRPPFPPPPPDFK